MRADALRTFRELKLDEVRPIDRFTQGGPELRLKRADAVEAPTLARVYAIAGMAAGEQLVAAAHVLSATACCQREGEPADRAVHHRRVDPATLAAAFHSDKRPEDRHRGLKAAAADIRQLHRQRYGWAVAIAVQAKGAGRGDVVDVVARARCERTVLSVAGDRAHDELGIACLEHVPSEAEALHYAWPVALDEHCGTLCQAKEHLEACL